MKKQSLIVACIAFATGTLNGKAADASKPTETKKPSFWEKTKASASGTAKKISGTDDASLEKKGKDLLAKIEKNPNQKDYESLIKLQKQSSSNATARKFDEWVNKARRAMENQELKKMEPELKAKAEQETKRREAAQQAEKERREREERAAEQERKKALAEEKRAREQERQKALAEEKRIRDQELQREFEIEYAKLPAKQEKAGFDADAQKSEGPQLYFNREIDGLLQKYKTPEQQEKLKNLKFKLFGSHY